MNINPITQVINMPDGSSITLETGKLAKQADGSVVVRQGDTMLLATVVAAKEAKEGQGFFPLSVEYREKFPAAGRMPGGYLKREARPADYEILTCRLVDRAIRPLFPDGYMCETQVILNLLSHDENVSPDSLACLGAAAALAVSDIPFAGPVSEVKIGRIDGQMIINPSSAQTEQSDLDMIIAASADNVMMVEGEMLEISELEMIEAINFAHEAIKVQCAGIQALADQVEKSKVKRPFEPEAIDEALYAEVKAATYDKIYQMTSAGINDKHKRKEITQEAIDSYLESLSEEELAEKGAKAKSYFSKISKDAVRVAMLDCQKRLDGRAHNEIRQIWGEVDYLPSTHGSAIFTRGETQALASVTLGTKLDEQTTDGVSIQKKEKFYLHYNFPPFCTGEAKPIRGVSRREIGHGNLAQRALKNMVPSDDSNPYTIRVVSDVLESNGSSSMATVCAGTMSLMDAGIQLKAPVSGIAMGMIAESDGRYMILSDILGDEDHLGDMDFKVTGTRNGITACQMDIKVEGLSSETLAEALEQAKQGRLHILDKIEEVIAAPNADVKEHAPRMEQFTIATEFMGAVIGPGGKVIQELQKDTETTITLTEIPGTETAHVQVAGIIKEGVDKAIATIKGIASKPEKGEVYEGKVKAILAFGAIVEILPGKEGLLHISEIDHKRIEDVNDVLKVDDVIKVKLLDVDPKNGKLKLSIKALTPRPPRPEKKAEANEQQAN